MSAENISPSFSEKQKQPQELEQLLTDARNDFYGISTNTDFENLLVQRKIGPDDFYTSAYWRAAADFARGTSTEASTSDPDVDKNEFKELFAATPNFIYSQARLSENRSSLDSREQRDLLEQVSYFHGLIRRVALEHQDLVASNLINRLQSIAVMSIEDQSLQEASTYYIRRAVRGDQHELAFGHLLARTGRNFRASTVDDDLRGIDYVVRDKSGALLNIDVKASLSEIETKAKPNQPYKIAQDRVVMYSLLTDRDLNDRFVASESIMSQRSQYLDQLMDEIGHPQAALSLVS